MNKQLKLLQFSGSIKFNNTKRIPWINTSIIIAYLFSAMFFLYGCAAIEKIADAITNSINKTNIVLDEAVDQLGASSEDWENIVRDALDEIPNWQRQVKADLQEALNDAITAAGTEYRCSAQFTADMLIHKILVIKAEFNGEDPPLAVPQICNINPSVIDMNLSPNSRNKITITGYFFNQGGVDFTLFHRLNNGIISDVTDLGLSINTDYKMIIDLGNTGIRIDDNSDKLILKQNDVVASNIEVIHRLPQPCNTYTDNISLPRVVVYPEHKKLPGINKPKGDKDFADNGPCIRGNVSLYTRNGGTEIWCYAFVYAWECPDNLNKSKKDYTYGDKEVRQFLARVRDGYKIKRFQSPTSDSFQYIDKDEHTTETISGSGPVLNYLIEGDTQGDDLGRTRVEISLRSVSVLLEEVGECISN